MLSVGEPPAGHWDALGELGDELGAPVCHGRVTAAQVSSQTSGGHLVLLENQRSRERDPSAPESLGEGLWGDAALTPPVPSAGKKQGYGASPWQSWAVSLPTSHLREPTARKLREKRNFHQNT